MITTDVVRSIAHNSNQFIPTLALETEYIIVTMNPDIEKVKATISRTNKKEITYDGLHIGNGEYEFTSSYNAKIKITPEEDNTSKYRIYYYNSVDNVYCVTMAKLIMED